jgi:hypothetical protein
MITNITDETTVKELREIINYVCKRENDDLVRLILFDDGTGRFDTSENVSICEIYNFEKYVKSDPRAVKINRGVYTQEELEKHIENILIDERSKDILIKKLLSK